MNKWASFAVLLVFCGLTVGCKDEKKTNTIITHKPIIMRSAKTQKMGDYDQSRQIEWLGNVYTLQISFKADPSLPIVSDGSHKYYDNQIILSILRKDGTVFFSKTFTKTNFQSYVDKSYTQDGALLGIVFDRIEGGQLLFAVSIGSPDKSSDEYIPLLLKISRNGEVTIKQDSQLDTTSSDNNSNSKVDESEEEGE